MQLTLQQLFGARAYQDSDRLVINKGDLPKLSVNAANTAESLLVAILLRAFQQFEGFIEDGSGSAIEDELGRMISYDNSSLYKLLVISFWKRQFIIFQDLPKIIDTFVIESYEVQ